MGITFYIKRNAEGRHLVVERQESCGGDHCDRAELSKDPRHGYAVTYATRDEAVAAARRCYRRARRHMAEDFGPGAAGQVRLVLDHAIHTHVGEGEIR